MVDKHKKSDTGIAHKLIAELINTTYRPFSMAFFYVFLKLSEKKYQLSRVRDWRHLSSNSALRKQLISQLSKVRRMLQSKEMRKKEADILFHQRQLLYTLIQFTKISHFTGTTAVHL